MSTRLTGEGRDVGGGGSVDKMGHFFSRSCDSGGDYCDSADEANKMHGTAGPALATSRSLLLSFKQVEA